MPKYDNSKIYRVIDSQGYYFIGATTSLLRFILSKHKKLAIIDNDIQYINISIQLIGIM
jgi:hypothetical protein